MTVTATSLPRATRIDITRLTLAVVAVLLTVLAAPAYALGWAAGSTVRAALFLRDAAALGYADACGPGPR